MNKDIKLKLDKQKVFFLKDVTGVIYAFYLPEIISKALPELRKKYVRLDLRGSRKYDANCTVDFLTHLEEKYSPKVKGRSKNKTGENLVNCGKVSY